MPISSTSNAGSGDTQEHPSRLSVPFARQVPAADSDQLTYEAKADATVERILVRIYAGAENTLRITPKKREEDGGEYPLLQFEGKQYIDGDDDVFEFNLSEPVHSGDEVVVDYENTDGQNAHNFRATVDVDYLGGTERVARGIMEVLA